VTQIRTFFLNFLFQCHFPNLSLSIDGLKFAVPKTIHTNCRSSFFPVSIDNYAVRLIHKYRICTVHFYLGQGDRHYRNIPIVLPYNVNISLLSDHFTVQCKQPNNALTSIKRTSHPAMPYASIRYDQNVRRRLAAVTKQNDDFNLLILGLDSVSRLQFERMLPKTFAYVTKTLDGIVLKGQFIISFFFLNINF
jgi:hypothetical protein